MTLSVFAFLCIIVRALAYNDLDYEFEFEGRIFGGTEQTVDGAMPWIAMVVVVDADLMPLQACGGAIVNNVTIITAGQCLADLPPLGAAAAQVLVFMGAVSIPVIADAIPSLVSNYTHHPNFRVNSDDFDIAIITLAAPQAESDTIKYLNLPSGGQIKKMDSFDNMTATVYGFGAHDSASTLPAGTLSFVEMKVLPQKACAAKMKEVYYQLFASQMCTDTEKATKGICKFDAGNPLTVVLDGVVTMVGVASYYEDCETKYPNVFTRIGAKDVLKWIAKNGGPKEKK